MYLLVVYFYLFIYFIVILVSEERAVKCFSLQPSTTLIWSFLVAVYSHVDQLAGLPAALVFYSNHNSKTHRC